MIRIAEETDRAVWLELRRLVYTDCEDALNEAEVKVWLNDDDKECFLAEREGKVVGFLEASLRNIVDGCLSSPVGYIEGICVFPEYRGQGISRQLMASAEAWMKSKACSEMGSDSELENDEAIRFHKAIGFEETYRVVQFKKKLR